MIFFIPGQVISAFTFPGVIVHEAAHLLMCRVRRVAVLETCFFRFGNPAGYVIHERTDDFTTTFLVSMGPFLVNTVLCFFICFAGFAPLRMFDVFDPLSYLLLWLGLSIGMHAIPSTGDASVLRQEAREAAKKGNLLAILSLPLVVLVFIVNVARFFWADLAYGAVIGLVLPLLIVDKVL